MNIFNKVKSAIINQMHQFSALLFHADSYYYFYLNNWYSMSDNESPVMRSLIEVEYNNNNSKTVIQFAVKLSNEKL